MPKLFKKLNGGLQVYNLLLEALEPLAAADCILLMP